VARKQVNVLVLVAGRDEPLETQRLELVGEIVEEIGNTGVVAIAKDRFAFEMSLVMGQLAFDVGELRIKLVLFRFFRVIQQFVGHVLSFLPARREKRMGNKKSTPFLCPRILLEAPRKSLARIREAETAHPGGARLQLDFRAIR
jgi:hypothetical protein